MIKLLEFIFVIFSFLALFPQLTFSQDPYEIDQFPFVNYEVNSLIFPGDSIAFSRLFQSFNTLILKGDGQINVVHIGDSHIQADFFSGRVRQRLQTFFQGGIGGRGFIFPYTVAKSNNPESYKVAYTGSWEHCRNVDRDKDNLCSLGLSGISVTTNDSAASISIKLRDKEEPKYTFNKVKIFHTIDSTSLTVDVDNYKEKKMMEYDDHLGYTMFILKNYLDSVNLKFIRKDSTQKNFTLHGISLETYDPGVVYHAIGVNGAKVSSYLKCTYFKEHLNALLPDLLIISLGTNDSYVKKFDTLSYYNSLDSMIRMIYAVAPNSGIILTVPGDSYLFKKKANKNIQAARDVIFLLAKKYNCAVWDFYTIMGGEESIDTWIKNNLAVKDKLHFTKKGYTLQGDLFFNAFLKAYDAYIDKIVKKEGL